MTTTTMYSVCVGGGEGVSLSLREDMFDQRGLDPRWTGSNVSSILWVWLNIFRYNSAGQLETVFLSFWRYLDNNLKNHITRYLPYLGEGHHVGRTDKRSQVDCKYECRDLSRKCPQRSVKDNKMIKCTTVHVTKLFRNTLPSKAALLVKTNSPTIIIHTNLTCLERPLLDIMRGRYTQVSLHLPKLTNIMDERVWFNSDN